MMFILIMLSQCCANHVLVWSMNPVAALPSMGIVIVRGTEFLISFSNYRMHISKFNMPCLTLFSSRIGRSDIGYSSRSSIPSQDSRALYSRRQIMDYGGGAYLSNVFKL